MKTEKTSTIDPFILLEKINLPQVILPALAAIASVGAVFYAASHLLDLLSFTKPTKTIPAISLPPKAIPNSKDFTPQQKGEIEKTYQKPLTENNCLYEQDLSWEKIQIQAKLTDHQDLITYILSAKGNDRKVAFGILLTLVGIKPSLILALNKVPEEIKKILKNKKTWVTIQEFDFSPERTSYARHSIPITQPLKNDRQICITNEKPLEAFDPRQFLHPLQANPDVSLSDATIYCFLEQHRQNAEQMLSYLLGFGPSWEAYHANSRSNFNQEDSIFTDAHYKQLGKLFSKDHPTEMGYLLHLQRGTFAIPSPTPTEIENVLSNTFSLQVIDAVSAQTEYFQKSYTLKKWLLDTYFANS